MLIQQSPSANKVDNIDNSASNIKSAVKKDAKIIEDLNSRMIGLTNE